MTCERVDMATPDNLVLLDTNAVDTSMLSQRDESDQTQSERDVNPPTDHPPECAGSNPDGTTEIRDTERASDLVLIQPSDGDLLDQTSQSLKDTNAFLHSKQHKPSDHEQNDITLNPRASSESHEISLMPKNVETALINIDQSSTDTLNISTVLTRASSVLDSLSMINNVLETADGSDNNNSAILTLNNTDNFVFPAVDSCTSFITQTALNLDVKPVTCTNDLPIDIVITDHSDNLSLKIGAKDERNPSKTPDNTRDLGTEESEGVSLKFTGMKRDGEVCNETWLDACQFLAGEEDGGAILDECGRSLSPSPPVTNPDNTKASGFPMGDNISIDRHAENRELFATVERWSSTDSWASALSDWFQVSTYPDDSFIGTNTDSKLGMAIQDTSVEQRTNPDNTNLTGQTCVSLKLLEPLVDEALDTEQKCDKTNGKQGDLDRQLNVIVEDKVNLSEPVVKRESHMPEMKANAEMSCGSPGSEFSVEKCGSQHMSEELGSAKEGDAPLTLDFKEDRKSTSGAQRISAYTSDKNLTVTLRSDVDLHTCPTQSNGHLSSEVKHRQGVETDETCVSRSFIEGDGSYEGFNAEDFTVKPKETSNPEFIMPFAPLSTGNTFLHHGVLKQDVSQADVDVNNEIRPLIESGQKSCNNEDSFTDRLLSCGDTDHSSMKDSWRKQYSNTCDISKELSNFILLTGEHFMVSDKKRVAYVTLDLDKPRSLSFSNHVNSEAQNCSCAAQTKTDKMPHKTPKTSDGKARSKLKEKVSDQHMPKKLEKPSSQEKSEVISKETGCEDRAVTVIETIVITEKITPKAQGKKKKKHAKPETDPPTEVRNRTVQKIANSKVENLEVKVASNGLDKPASHLSTKVDNVNKNSTQKPMAVRPKAEASGSIVTKMIPDNTDTSQKTINVKPDTSGINVAKIENKTCTLDPQSTCLSGMINDDAKRRRIANDLSGTIPVRTRPQLPAIFRQSRKDGEDVTKRAYSEVVKQKIPAPKEVVVSRVVSEIQAEPVPADPQNISLWCRFSPVPPDATIKWTKEGTVLSESRKGEGEDERFTLTILKASSKDLGLYKCSLNTSSISVSTSEYHLTSEVLMELVIPSHDQPAEPRIVEGDEESIQCSPLLFKDDFLSDQYFGENQPASIVTEKVHFGEGMHRKAFRTTLRAGKLPSFYPGHPCVLKVHNAIGYGAKDNNELIQRNYSLAVEECHVQNTAREYIKAYYNVAKSAESFGEVPEIIPIYLVHRPSNDIPYATLEEELLGDFVKYSVKDGKEINLMRRDSEAGQKCCAFQHWVYSQTEGNLLITDMQGVGMKLTDVGIATCKKGYKGFRGNCATSFIDQFKALHMCNRYCELLGLKSLQPKPKRIVPPKPKAQPAPKKNPFGSVLKGKS